MHFDTSISLGAVVGWAVTAISLAYGIGKIVQVVEHLGGIVNELKEQHANHCEDDIKRFTSVGEQLTQIATSMMRR